MANSLALVKPTHFSRRLSSCCRRQLGGQIPEGCVASHPTCHASRPDQPVALRHIP